MIRIGLGGLGQIVLTLGQGSCLLSKLGRGIGLVLQNLSLCLRILVNLLLKRILHLLLSLLKLCIRFRVRSLFLLVVSGLSGYFALLLGEFTQLRKLLQPSLIFLDCLLNGL